MKNILNQLQIKKEKILQQIGELGDFRQGSLSPRYRKCGKPYCHCAKEGSSNFETLETLVRDTSLRLGASILETMINSDKNDQHSTFIHPDGTLMDYAGRKEKTFIIVLGDITLKRAYYTDKNGRGYFPRDKKPGTFELSTFS